MKNKFLKLSFEFLILDIGNNCKRIEGEHWIEQVVASKKVPQNIKSRKFDNGENVFVCAIFTKICLSVRYGWNINFLQVYYFF